MSEGELTRLLRDAEAGGAEALERALPLLYEELREIARRHLRSERPGHTLETAALVNEAYLKLVDQDRVAWRNRAHVLGVASLAMRRILVSHARSRGRQKRGGGSLRVTLVEALGAAAGDRGIEIVELDRLLQRLAEFDPRAARIVECRVFGALSIEETAEALAVSPATVKRSWRIARAWLHREMTGDGEAGTGS